MTGKIDIQDSKVVFGSVGLKKAIRGLPDGSYMWWLEEWKEGRTNLQNAFIHACFDKYGQEYGYSAGIAKYLLKKEFGVNRLQKHHRTGKQELIVRDTSDYSLEEMTVFIQRLLDHFEYDCGIIIDPETRKQYRLDEITGELTSISPT